MITIKWSSAIWEGMIRKAKGDVQGFVSEFLQDLNNEMVFTTPVRLGFLRGSWFAGLNEVPTQAGSKDPSGANVSELNAVVAKFTIGDTYYLVNTAAYAARVEYGFFGVDSLGRHYSQAGRGWIRAVVARSGEIASAAALRVSGRS